MSRDYHNDVKLKDRFWNLWQNSWFFPGYLERSLIRRSIENIAPEIDGGILLDIGCGSKPYFKFLNGRVNLYIGMEYARPENAEIISTDLYGDAVDLPIKSNSVDVVLSTQVLEHLPKPEAFFKEAMRVLRPGAKLYLTTNQEWGIHKAPFDFFRFTRYGLKFLCESSGLQSLKIENRGGFWVMMGQRLSAYIYDRWVDRFRGNYKIVFLITFLLSLPVIPAIQLLALLADRLDYIKENTIGYFLIAQKPQ